MIWATTVAAFTNEWDLHNNFCYKVTSSSLCIWATIKFGCYCFIFGITCLYSQAYHNFLTNFWVSKLSACNLCINTTPVVITHSTPLVVHTHFHSPSSWGCSSANKPDVSMSTTCIYSSSCFDTYVQPCVYYVMVCLHDMHCNTHGICKRGNVESHSPYSFVHQNTF